MSLESLNDANSADLEKLVKQENIASYNPLCVRKKSNWSTTSNEYKFDHEDFSPETLLKDMNHHSPKLKALLKKIKALDNRDYKKHGKVFKHFIFSDLKNGNYGAKLIASALIASGMPLGYTATPKKTTKKSEKRYGKLELLTDKQLLETEGENFYLLSSTPVYDQPIPVATKKEILKRFNSRDDNVYGKFARIIVMDSGFKEGIDLFDIKYIHIFEPSTVPADQKQVIGRGTRTCGQKGLDFHPTRGWPLHVFIYDLSIPEKIRGSFLNARTAMDLYFKAMNINIQLVNFSSEIENMTIIGSVDYELNKNIHGFSIAFDDSDDEESLGDDDEFELLDDDSAIPIEGLRELGKVANRNVVRHGNIDWQTQYVGGGPKLKIRNREPIIISNAQPEVIPLNFEQMRQHIREHYHQYSWDAVKMENLCAPTKQNGGTSKPIGGASIQIGGADLIKYTPTQDFVRNYFTTNNPLKGMLLFQSVGTGKTCSAIAAATNTFEKEGYTILWVTRHTLKNDIWKNMFEQVCNENIRTEIENHDLKIPADQNKRMRLLSKSWKIRPMSYKQFSNLVSKKNDYYKKLVQINGEIDPLRKTLLVIDEAHKLYGGGDLSNIERPDMDAFHKALMNSYALSGRDSVKLLLMTATPMTDDPMEMIKLLNLLRPAERQMPHEFNSFAAEYLDEQGQFTEDGRHKYLDNIAGYVSYLNRERDARQFAQPIIQEVNVPITNDIESVERFDKKIMRDYMNSDIAELKNKVVEKNKSLQGELTEADKNMFSFLKEETCGELEGKPLKLCEKVVKSNIKELVQEAKVEIKKIRGEIKEIRELIKNRNLLRKTALDGVKDNVKNHEEEFEEYKKSVIYQMKNKCGKKISGKIALKDFAENDPETRTYNEALAAYNNKIDELKGMLKTDLENHKKRIDHLKKILKKDLSELESSVIKSTIVDERKAFNGVIRIKRRDATKTQKDIKKRIKEVEKSKKKRFQQLKKTVKKMSNVEKKKERGIARVEKKLRKTLRKQGEMEEEIKHDVLVNLVDKYRLKIMDDLSGADEVVHQKELEKDAERLEKQKAREDARLAKALEKEQLRKTKKAIKEKEKHDKKEEKERAKQEDKERKAIEKEHKAIEKAKTKSSNKTKKAPK